MPSHICCSTGYVGGTDLWYLEYNLLFSAIINLCECKILICLLHITALDVWHFRGGRFKGFHALNNVGQEDSNQGLGIKSEE